MKKKILIASLLKPVDDVRSYWKLSKSMSKTNKYDINIIGNATKKLPNDPYVHFYPYPIKRNQFVRRWFRSFLLLFSFCKLKPDVLIITTPELLFSALACKVIIGCKLIYDVQENHRANLTLSNSGFFGKLAGVGIRILEQTSRPFIDQYWLAEACYKSELKFTTGKSTVIENKAFNQQHFSRDYSNLRLLFSGTISEYAGIKLAVYWYQKIREVQPNCMLTIMGQIHDKELFAWLIELEKTDVGITLKASFEPVPHPEILKEIQQANLGLISYEENDINRNKIPTKLYEYSRDRLPYLIVKDSTWSRVGNTLGGAIPLEPNVQDAQKIVELLRSPSNFFPKYYPEMATWEYESNHLLNSINTLFD